MTRREQGGKGISDQYICDKVLERLEIRRHGRV